MGARGSRTSYQDRPLRKSGSSRATEAAVALNSGLALGTGSSIDTALENLETEGMRQAQELAAGLAGDEREDAEWPFQIVDVKLVAGPPDSSSEAWAAIGTLTSRGATPWSGSYWDQSPPT